MRARTWAVLALLWSEVALAEPKPTAVDIKPFRSKLQMFVDGKGGLYAIAWLDGDEKPRVFYGATAKTIYEQDQTSRFFDKSQGTWSLALSAPRLSDVRPGSIDRKADGTYLKSCDGKDDAVLTELTGDKAKAAIDHTQFMTTAMMYVPVVLARDTSGTYFYVDRLRKQYGGKGFRVWVGKRGAMKLTPLSDVASDSAGEVFATKNGELRLVHGDGPPTSAEWVRGTAQPAKLTVLDPDINSPLIFNDLGVYSFLGSVCDNVTN